MVEARINSDSFLNDGPRLTPIAQFGQIIKAWSQPQRLTLSSTVTLDPALRCRPPRLFFLPSTIIYHLFSFSFVHPIPFACQPASLLLGGTARLSLRPFLMPTGAIHGDYEPLDRYDG